MRNDNDFILRQSVNQSNGIKPVNNADDLPKAEYWLNLGIRTTDEHGEDKFISLVSGIPLDTYKDSAPAQSIKLNNNFIQLGSKLKPGQSAYVDKTSNGFWLQIRRVGEKQASPEASAAIDNVFANVGFIE